MPDDTRCTCLVSRKPCTATRHVDPAATIITGHPGYDVTPGFSYPAATCSHGAHRLLDSGLLQCVYCGNEKPQMSTDFPGTRFGRGDTITIIDASTVTPESASAFNPDGTCAHGDPITCVADTGRRICYDCGKELAPATAEFMMRVLTLFALSPNDLCEDLFWRVDGNFAPITFFVNCNDTFHWATSDAENVTPDNIGVFEQALADLKTVTKYPDIWVCELFAARMRGMRPMRLAYPKDEPGVCALFDACGPERDPKTEG